ncbi:MAG: hypothetical protein D6806_17720 [Deltaproteobacteria bacterium]|nr:MAG: hypothetical protein D6806_17720 [Deltaproteobacteria bacterium]
MGTKRIINLRSLNRALGRVIDELDRHGFWTEKIYSVDVYLVPLGAALGWFWKNGNGQICIPAVSFGDLGRLFRRKKACSLADIIRHEYGHAVAHHYRGLIRSRRFSDAFGASYFSDTSFEYDEDFHVTEYAASEPAEDFAEVFMLYLKHDGRLPASYSTPWIRKKWAFVRQLSTMIRKGKARWD